MDDIDDDRLFKFCPVTLTGGSHSVSETAPLSGIEFISLLFFGIDDLIGIVQSGLYIQREREISQFYIGDIKLTFGYFSEEESLFILQTLVTYNRGEKNNMKVQREETQKKYYQDHP